MRLAALPMALTLMAAADAPAAVDVPARFVADGVYVDLRLANGRNLELYTDSGGGSVLVSRAAAKRAGLEVAPISDPEAKAELGPDAGSAAPPRLAAFLPPLPVRVFVVGRAAQIPSWPEQADGFLGAKWFEGGIWTWDYPRHRLRREASDWRPSRQLQATTLGFKVEPDGSRPTNFARIDVDVDGHATPMLLDTGAETFLTEQALATLDDHGPRLRSTSMLQASDFDDLHRRHPDWRYIPEAQVATKAPMILVPSVGIAGIASGPVWFTRRSDAAYKQFMSSMMDRPVVGSLGGNALHDLAITVDFVHARAFLRRPTR